MSDLIGARLAQQAAAAGGELSLSVDDTPARAGLRELGPDRVVLVARPRAVLAGAQAGRRGAGRRHRLADPGRLRDLVGHEHGLPAVAGAAALLHQRHPSWTPAQIKSALVLTARPVFNDTAHKHPTSVLAAGGGMIDVQAADAARALRRALGRDLRAAARRTSRDALGRAERRGGGAGTWSVSAPGLDAPPRSACPPAARQKLELSLSPPRAARSAIAPATSCSPRARTRCTSAGGATSSARGSPKCTRSRSGRALGAGDTRDGPELVEHYRWPAGPAGSGLPRVYPGREQLWSFTMPHGARNAGVEAEGAVVPQILLARDENRLAGEPALPSVGNPYLETYGRFERVSGLLVPARAATSSSSRRGPGTARPLPAAALGQRPHAAEDQRDRAHIATGRRADLPRRRHPAAASAPPTSS